MKIKVCRFYGEGKCSTVFADVSLKHCGSDWMVCFSGLIYYYPSTIIDHFIAHDVLEISPNHHICKSDALNLIDALEFIEPFIMPIPMKS